MSSISVNTITDASGGATTSINGFTPSVSNMAGRNRIINGDMRIDQRNAGASVTVNTWSAYPVDRFFGSFRPSTGTATAQQVSDAPSNFVYSLKLTQASVTIQAAADYYGIIQRIEGYNVADMNFGSANAKTFTLSFWVKSSVTGTYGLAFQNINATRRSYVTTYTINSANTWEQKTITVAGDQSGTWEVTNSSGLVIQWDLGSGSDYQTSTLNAWQTSNVIQASGATRWIDTNGATFYITGVQLEAGSVATPFEHRQYGQELYLCKRYFEIWKYEPAVGIDRYRAGCGWADSAVFNMEVQKRASPTVAIGGSAEMRDGGNAARPITLADSNSNVIRLGTSPTSLTYSVATIRFASGLGDFVSMSAEL